jgi:hypothetical protein
VTLLSLPRIEKRKWEEKEKEKEEVHDDFFD